MTCIVGWTDGTRMVMGGDSLGADTSFNARVRRDRKVFRLRQEGGPDVLIGFTSSYRMGQLLMGLTLPPDFGPNPFHWMVETFIPAVRARLRDGGYTEISSNVERGGTFIVLYRGCVFTVQSDFQVKVPADPFDAVGCGGAYALGALSVLDIAADPESTIRRALTVAETLSAGVRGPMHVEAVRL